MRILVASLIMLASIALYSGCGDSATEIVGTLPVVTGITVDSVASSGDSIVVTWNEITGAQIEGYLFWYRIHIQDPWMLAEAVDQNSAIHIADRSVYYTVLAYNGDDTSSDIGVPDNCRADELMESKRLFSARPVGFRIDLEGDSLVSGDPSSALFRQQFTIAVDGLGVRYIYPGTAHPDVWPGGMESMVSSSGGFVAPPPGDSTLWQDSILYGGDFFLALESGYFCKLTGLIITPDTLSFADTLLIDGQIQPIRDVRIFNQTW